MPQPGSDNQDGGDESNKENLLPPIDPTNAPNRDDLRSARSDASYWSVLKRKLEEHKMGDGSRLDEMMRMRDTMNMRFTSRFQEWWDKQIEQRQKEEELLRQNGGREMSLAQRINVQRQQV